MNVSPGQLLQFCTAPLERSFEIRSARVDGDFERSLAAKGNTVEYVHLVVSRLSTLFDGCNFRTTASFSASKVSEWLASIRLDTVPTVELKPGQMWFSPKQAAQLLGVSGPHFEVMSSVCH